MRKCVNNFPASGKSDQFVSAVEKFLQAPGRHVVRKNANIGFAGDDRVDDLIAEFLLQADAYQRLLAQERGKIVGEELNNGGPIGPT